MDKIRLGDEIGEQRLLITAAQTGVSNAEEDLNRTTEEILRLRALLAEKRRGLIPQTEDIEELRALERRLREKLAKAGGDPNKKQKIYETISQNKKQINELNTEIYNIGNDVNRLIFDLNQALNRCKRTELLVKEFEKEFNVMKKILLILCFIDHSLSSFFRLSVNFL